MLRSSSLALWRGAHLLGASALRSGEEHLGAVELCWSPCAPRMLLARHEKPHLEVVMQTPFRSCGPPADHGIQ